MNFTCVHDIHAASDQVGHLGEVWECEKSAAWLVLHLRNFDPEKLVTTHVFGNGTANTSKKMILKEPSFLFFFNVAAKLQDSNIYSIKSL